MANFRFIYIESTASITEYNIYSKGTNLPLGKIVHTGSEFRMFFFSSYSNIGVSQDVMAECLLALEAANDRVSYQLESQKTESIEYDF